MSMTTITKTALAALLLAAFTAAAPASAATPSDGGFSPDGEPFCMFVADAGHYVCEEVGFRVADSLVEPVDPRAGRRRGTISGPSVDPTLPFPQWP
jgi:hypothetical protein